MKWRIILPVGLFIALGAWWFVGTKGQESSPKSSGLIKEATAQEILAHVKSLNSPVTVLNFWASWCEPCKSEFPHLLAVNEKFAAKGMRLVLVSVDGRDELGAAEEFLMQQKVTTPSFYKGKQSLKFVSDIFPDWKGAIPATVIFDHEGKVVDAWEGENTQADFEKHILPHLGNSP